MQYLSDVVFSMSKVMIWGWKFSGKQNLEYLREQKYTQLRNHIKGIVTMGFSQRRNLLAPC